MLDGDGFRLNVGMVLINQSGQVFGASARNAGWQFPQEALMKVNRLSRRCFVNCKKKPASNRPMFMFWVARKIGIDTICRAVSGVNRRDAWVKSRNGFCCVEQR